MNKLVPDGSHHRLRAHIRALIADFVGAVVTGKSLQRSFEDGPKNQRVLDAAQESARSGRWMNL